MATKISAMPPAASSLLTHQYEVNEGGVTKRVDTQQNIDLYSTIFQPSSVKAANVKYVAKNGNDLSGDGSFYFPYATVYKAMSEITDASISNTYTIFYLGTETFDVLPVLVKPYTSIVSFSSEISSNLQLTLDTAAWTAQPSGIFVLKNITVGEVDFDFSFLTSKNPKIRFVSTSANGTINLNGGENFGEVRIFQSSYQNINIYNTFSFVELGENTYNGNFNIGVTTPLTSSAVLSVVSIGDIFRGNINLKAPNTVNQTQVTIIGAKRNFGIPITAEGNQLFIDIDSTSLSSTAITVLGGTPSVNYIDSAKAISSDFVPTNYPTTNNQITGQFGGIDIKFGNVDTSLTGKLDATSPTPFTIPVSGPFPSVNFNGQFSLIGNTVVMRFYYFEATITAGASIITSAAGAVPAQFRPTTQEVTHVVSIFNNAAPTISSAGLLKISTAGTITITDINGGAFAATGNAGINGGCIVYTTA